MREELDVLYDMPFPLAVWLSGAAFLLYEDVCKILGNASTCKTFRLENAGVLYSPTEDKVVPRKQRVANVSTNDRASDTSAGDDLRFINIKIPEGAEEELLRLLGDLPALCLSFMELTAGGNAILLKRKRGTEDWLAMVTFDDPYREGLFCAITAWGSDPASAIASFLYKWDTVLGRVLPEVGSSGNGPRKRFG